MSTKWKWFSVLMGVFGAIYLYFGLPHAGMKAGFLCISAMAFYLGILITIDQATTKMNKALPIKGRGCYMAPEQ